MMQSLAVICVATAACLHFIQVPGTYAVARAIGLHQELQRLPRLAFRIVLVLGLAAVSLLVSLGAMLLVSIVLGELQRSMTLQLMTLWLGLFWLLRALVQARAYNEDWPRTRLPWLLHLALLVLFVVKGLLFVFGGLLLLSAD